jgi:phosphate transport system substrate-binding protein
VKIVRHGARVRTAAAGLAAAALLLTGCGASAAPAGGDGAERPVSTLTGSITGAGASSQAAAMEAWIAGFTAAHPGTRITYDPVGSGDGRERFTTGGTAFGGTDAYLDDEELPVAVQRCGGNVLEIPAYISPIAVAFNLAGIRSLNLTPAVIAGIFAKKITNWSDPAIVADNAGVPLPDLPITTVHRLDESGTTENFVDYLAAAAPDVWTFEVDGDWPAEIQGVAAPQNSGVVEAIASANGTIGYADASQVGQLGVAVVGVGDAFVPYYPEAAAAIVENSPQNDVGRPAGSFALDLQRDTTQSGSYPIVLVSYELACGAYPDQQTADLVKAFLSYVISAEGQRVASEAAGSAPISETQRQQYQTAIDSITGGV